jgi:hypothetical protein
MIEELVRRNENYLLSRIEELELYNSEILSASAEIRSRANELERDNKRLRERLYAEIDEKRCCMQLKDTED